MTARLIRAAALAFCLPVAAFAQADPLSYNRDIRPILSDKCFKCHGPDAAARKGKLRLDVRDDALRPREPAPAIVPGQPAASELVLRLDSTDPEEQMPPPDSGAQLTSSEKAVLRRWISEGAAYEAHWSFVPPRAPALPVVRQATWPRNGIDHFILHRLEASGLAPSPEADRATLLRRVSFDLTGLPPTPAELDAFLADRSPQAYERVVDRLLASPAYGERMAVDWLDAARYADTNGLFRDNTRQVWPWRDWVVDAFNRNLPYDVFTIEQLAGDLLPHPTDAQRIATGFNRNHVVTGETGVIDEEYRVEYVADRLETTGAVWLGLTLGCARCHDHKYDPLPQADYYRLFAFFNSGVEKGLINPDDPPPVMDVTSETQRAELARLGAARREAEQAWKRREEPLGPALAAWEARMKVCHELAGPSGAGVTRVDFEPDPAGAAPVEKGTVYREGGIVGKAAVFDGMQHLELPATTPLAADRPWTVGLWVKPTSSLVCLVSKIQSDGDRRGFEVIWAKGQLQINLVHRWVSSAIEVVTRDSVKRSDWTHVVVAYDGSRQAGGVRVFADGVEVPLNVVRDSLQGPITNDEPLRIGRRDSGLGFYGQLDEFVLAERVLPPETIRTWFWGERLQGVWATAAGARDARQRRLLLDCFVEREGDEALRAQHRATARAREAEETFRAALPKTLVMQEVAQPRVTHVLKRGQYDAPGDAVEPGVPAVLPPLPPDAPGNRLGLARWLVDPANPLPARVAVNRLWQQCFGEGLVATANDFGLQGELPSHPDLLDWLATRFISDGWDIKQLLRLLVTSAAYRQASAATPDLLQRDPANRLIARGPRFRLPAEMIRDQALAASGLLVSKRGGPPVMPYQPPGLWEAVSYNGELSYQVDNGEGLWRRSLYSFWKRTAPPPGVQIFDGPTRETCVVRRPRTNTPLQALLLLNDEGQVEAARALAASVLAAGHASDAVRVADLFRRVVSRAPAAPESAALLGLHQRQQARYAADPAAARRLVEIGVSPRGRDRDPVELAGWTVVAQAVLNLDEAITRR